MKTIHGMKWKSVALGLIMALLFFSGVASAQTTPAKVLKPQKLVLGKTYSQWVAEYYKWALKAPESRNPLVDTTGAFCAEGQSGDVWFLAGIIRNTSATRTCTVPQGKALFIPLVQENFISTGETAKYCRQYVNSQVDGMTMISLTVDGKAVPYLRNNRAESPEYTVYLPPNNIFGVASGDYGPAVGDGYWVMLAPLSVGTHKIRLRGTSNTMSPFDIRYSLTVE